MNRIDRFLSRFTVQTRTAAGFAILLLMMAGLAVFSLAQMTRIGNDVRVLVELDDMDDSIASTYDQLARLNTMIHSFMRTRDSSDITLAKAESKALSLAVEDVFAKFGQHPLLASRQDAIRTSLDRHANALSIAAAASNRHQRSADRFLAVSIPIATTLYAMEVNPDATDSPQIAQAKRKLQASFASSLAAVIRYLVTLQPTDAETVHEDMNRFEATVNAQKITGQVRFDEFVAYIQSKLPAYRDEAKSIALAVAAESEAEADINQATVDLDRMLDQVKQASSNLRTQTIAIQLAEMATLHRFMMGITGLTILLGLLLAWLIGGSIARPISRMTSAMRNLSSGKLDVKIPALDHLDEIGRMAAATEVFKKNAIALKESESRYRELLENLIEGVYQTTPEGRFLSVNQAMADILGWDSPESLLSAFTDIGNQLYVDPFQRTLLLQAVREKGFVRSHEMEFYRKDGTIITVLLSARGIMAGGELIRIDGTLADISERKNADRKIENLAFYDPLTQLPNRRLLQDRLQQSIVSMARNPRDAALLFIDLDDFKTLNDTLGHAEGDLLLQEVARRITSCIRASDTVARLGGDEFVVILEDLSGRTEDAAVKTKEIGEKILSALNQPFFLASQERHSTASIGATLFGNQQTSIDDLMKQADMAMFQAKAEGRNKLHFFNPGLQVAVMARAAIEAELRRAIKQEQFLLHYQPQVDNLGRVSGAEALVRWQHPERGLVSPGEFIPVAEASGLILPIGNWVLNTACAQLVAWANKPETADLAVSVNVSARQFRQADFVEQVLAALDLSKANPRRLKLELTESMLVENIDDIIAKITTLKASGVSFSLDDFGTGYSSLSSLRRLPLDQLKIDQSFVRDLLVDSNQGAIAQAIITLAQTMGLSVIAEGVETKEQLDFLSDLGCSSFQGYLFSRPVPIESFEHLLTDIPHTFGTAASN